MLVGTHVPCTIITRRMKSALLVLGSLFGKCMRRRGQQRESTSTPGAPAPHHGNEHVISPPP